MTFKTKFAIAVAIFLWASAFVGIRAGLQGYSPEGLALLRYIIASIFMGIIYFRLKNKNKMRLNDISSLILIGAIGIGLYNITLNYGELSISSGVACFIISQAPIITTFLAVLFLGEQLNLSRFMGLLVSILGVIFITMGEKGGFHWDKSIFYMLIATVASAFYSVLQKPYLKKYHVIEVTTYLIWGGTLFLLLYISHLQQDLLHASAKATLMVIYLGIFPAAFGYIAWSYALAEIPAGRAVSFLYFTPFLATFLGWICLGEVPVWLSIVGGVLAIFGVWLVNRSYFLRPS
jgi:drug/metabolite transporter (DMT)-like permease